MADAISTTESTEDFDAIVAASLAEADEQEAQARIVTADQALDALIEASATASATADALKGDLDGYETAWEGMIANFLAAREAGNSETEVRKALQADAKASGTTHAGASLDSCQNLDLVALLYGLDGDLPEHGTIQWVWRPDAKNATGLLDGQESLSSLVRAVRAPSNKADVKEAGGESGVAFGKGVAEKIIRDAANKTEAIVNLRAKVNENKALIANFKEAQKAPKTADVLVKAAKGPLSKVAEALGAGLVDDKDTVKAVIAEIRVYLDEALAHDALSD
jgi:hypothetical protein